MNLKLALAICIVCMVAIVWYWIDSESSLESDI